MNRILYVEDDSINALVITKFLESEFVIDIANDSITALEKLSTNQYDIVLMDISLGNSPEDGPAILKKIQEQPQLSKLKVIALTAHAMQEDKEKYLSLGFHSYLSKPITRQGLLDHLNKIKNISFQD